MADKPEPVDKEPLAENLKQPNFKPLSDEAILELSKITVTDIGIAMADAKKNHPELYDFLNASIEPDA